MKRQGLGLLLCLSAASAKRALAQETEAPETTKAMHSSQVQIVSDEADEDAIGESAAIRIQRPFGIGVGAGAFMPSLFGGEISLSYNYGAHFQLELSSWSGTSDAKDDLDESPFVTLDKFDVEARLTQIRAKWFPSNSFYVAFGLGSRYIEFDLEASSGTNRIHETIKARSSVVGLGIGNLWSFDSGFYIGGEWLALAIPLKAKMNTEVSTQGNVTTDIAALERDAKDVADDLGKYTSAGVAMLQLGWQF